MGLSITASSNQTTLLNNNALANRSVNQATERLSAGKRSNHASDNPAGLIGAEQLRGDLIEISADSRSRSTERGQLHIQQSGRQIASNALSELRGLAVQSNGSTYSTEEQRAIQLQIDASLDGLDLLGQATAFALPAELSELRSGGSANVGDGNVAEAIELIDEQLTTVNLASAAAGAYEKYTLDVDQRLAEAKAVATAASLSEIEDANYARESSNLVIGQILLEASIRTQALSHKIQSDQATALFDTLS